MTPLAAIARFAALFAAILAFPRDSFPAPATPSAARPRPHAPPPREEPAEDAVCSACHADVGERFDAGAHGIAFGRAGSGIAAGHQCNTCHGAGTRHVESGGGRSASGEEGIFNPRTAAPERVSQLCLTCHRDAGRMHWSTGAHGTEGATCTSCHLVHQASGPDRPGLVRPGGVAETCGRCHPDKLASQRKASHMPVREGALSCADCHDPHGGAHPKLLRSPTTNDTCLRCHADKRGPFLWDHSPVVESCVTCHEPHGSQHDKLLLAKRPMMLCQGCHVGVSHPSTAYSRTDLDVQSNRLLGRSCVNCHVQIHGSNHPSGRFFLR